MDNGNMPPYPWGYYGGFYSFPHTSDYDRDIGWLVAAYKYIDSQYGDLAERVLKMETLYETIPQQVQDAVNAQMVIIREELTAFKNNIDEKIKTQNTNIAEMQRQINQFATTLASLVVTINLLEDSLKKYSDAGDEKLKAEIYDYIDSIAKEWPPVIDPTDGFTEDIQTTLNHIYQSMLWGITVDDLIGLNISVNDFIKQEVTVDKIVKWGGYYLPQIFGKIGYMYSPFTGLYVPQETVILELADLHVMSPAINVFITAMDTGTYGDIILQDQRDVDAIISKNISAHDFAWSNWILKFEKEKEETT